MCSSGVSIAAAARARLPAPSALTAWAWACLLSAPSTSVHAAQLMLASGRSLEKNASTCAASVMSSSPRSTSRSSCPARSATRRTSWPSIPSAPVTSSLTGAASQDRDVGVVPDHEAVRAGLAVAAAHGDVAPEQRGLHAPVEVADGGAGEQDRVLDLGPGDRAVLADRRVGADVAVAQLRAGADHRGTAHGRALQAGAGLDHDAPVHLRVDQLALVALDEVVEDQAVGLEHVLQAPRVLPPAADDMRLDPHTAVEEILDRVGDLELSTRGGLDRARGVVDAGGEHVDAH